MKLRARIGLAVTIALAVLGAASPVPLDPDGFRLAVPPWRFQFPQDHAAHPSFRTEWWYYTGHLRSAGRTFGYEVTFFRVALPGGPRAGASAWRARHVLFRHLALTDDRAQRFQSDDRAERQALDLAGADSTRYLVWIADDYAGLEADRRTHRVVASGDGVALDLRLDPQKPAVAHGSGGVSQKSAGEGNASHYYSITRLATRGRLVLGGDTLAVEGTSWMDHEFSSDTMSETHSGWDWFSVQLDDGRDLMLYQLRLKGAASNRSRPARSSKRTEATATSRARHSTCVRVAAGQARAPAGVIPAAGRCACPGRDWSSRSPPTVAGQELIVESMRGLAYWEGRVRVSGTSRGRPLAGEGYVELTGYAGPSPF